MESRHPSVGARYPAALDRSHCATGGHAALQEIEYFNHTCSSRANAAAGFILMALSKLPFSLWPVLSTWRYD